MPRTALDLSPEQWREYRTAEVLRHRQKGRSDTLEARWRSAYQLARSAAELLRSEFGADKVILFGSLAHQHWFTDRSDVDLAAWGIPPDRFFQAVAAVTGLSLDFQVGLVDPDSCNPALRAALEQEGVEL